MRADSGILVKISLALLSVVTVVTVLSLSMRYNELTKKRDKLKADVEQAQLQLEKLREEVDAEYNEEYIIKVAREELGYRMPDEVIYYNNLTK